MLFLVKGCLPQKDGELKEYGQIVFHFDQPKFSESHSIAVFKKNLLSLANDTLSNYSEIEDSDTININLSKGLFLTINIDEYKSIYLKPGDLLHIYYEEDTMYFKGSNQEINNHLNWLDYIKRNSPLYAPNVTLDSLIGNANLLNIKYESWLSNLSITDSSLNSKIKEIDQIELANIKQMYAWNYLMSKGIKDEGLNEDYINYNKSLIESGYFPYLNLLHIDYFMNYLLPHRQFEGQDQTTLPQFIDSVLQESNLSEPLIEYYRAKNIDHWLGVLGTGNKMDSMTLSYIENNKGSILNESLLRHLKKWQSLASGSSAPNFIMRNINGDSIDFSVYEHETLFINVWATWCGPCIKELPFLKKIESNLTDSLGILNISVDKNFEHWQQFVIKNDLNPNNNFWNNGSIFNKYSINYLPRYMVVDERNKIKELRTDSPSENSLFNK